MNRAESWYAIWTQSHCERVVAEQLHAKGFEAFLPEMSVWSTRAGASRLIKVPMFPGYLFVHDAMDKRRYIEMLKVRGIVRVLEDGWQRLTPLPDTEVEAIQRVVTSDLAVVPHAHLRKGERVRVVGGPLADVEGIFVEEKGQKGRLILSVDLLGRSVAVEIDAADVRSH